LAKLKAENWIDQSTRAVQMIWAIYNTWSCTVFTFQANWEISSNELLTFKEIQVKNIPLNKHVVPRDDHSNPS
jgi:hypothetical protein